MPDRHRDVDRLDHDATLPVQDAELVGEPEDVAKPFEITVAPSALEIADVRGAGDGPEIDHIVADVQMPPGIAGMEHEALGCVGELRLDQIPPHADHLGRLVHQGAGTAVGFACRGAADLETRLLQNLEGGDQNAFHLLGGQDFQRPPGIGEPRQGRERGTGRALGTPSVAAPGRCRNFGHGLACQSIPAPTALTAAVLPLQPPGDARWCRFRAPSFVYLLYAMTTRPRSRKCNLS